MKKRKIKRIFANLVMAVLILFLTFIGAFYILIIRGANEKLQTLWVCTAMTTMNHKYLATWFIDSETIDRILSENQIDDSEYDSKLDSFESSEPFLKRPTFFDGLLATQRDTLPYRSYYAEGYEKLDKGVYIKQVSDTSWTGFVMLVENPLRVKLVDTAYQFDKGQTVKQMVEESGATAGINGGGFVDGVNYDSNGGNPAGLVIENGILINPSIEDETVYNMIGINKKGVLVLKHCTARWAMENDIVSAVSFSPYVVVNSEGTVKNGTGGWGIAPRTAIGQRPSGEFIFLVIDGRQVGWSLGCDIDVLQEVLLSENVVNGAMLDGGSSTVMYHKNGYINKPSLGHERLINNCFVVE